MRQEESEVINNGTLLISHIRIRADKYDFLSCDSYISSHQVMPINRDWLYDHLVGNIGDLELIYRMDLGIIHAAGLIQDFIREEAQRLQLNYIKKPTNPFSSAEISSRAFARGEVFFGQLPEQDYSNFGFPPSFSLEGEYRVVVLHDSHNPNYDPEQVLIVPITRAEATVRIGKILLTHVPLGKGEYPFIKQDCFVSAHQMFAIRRDWLDQKRKGDILLRMPEVDLALLLAGDLTATKDRIVLAEIEKITQKALQEIEKQEKDA